MADVAMSWNAEPIIKTANRVLERNMVRAMLYAEGQAKRLVSRRNVGVGLRRDNPSKPGEPPKVVTGTLRSNISSAVARRGRDIIGALGVRKGPADKYARRLELGFVGTDARGRNYNQGPRPYLRPTIRANRRKLLRIMTGGRR